MESIVEICLVTLVGPWLYSIYLSHPKKVTAVFVLALPMAVVAAVLHWPLAWLIQRLYRITPFSEALDAYQKRIHCNPHPGPDAAHPHNQGLLVPTMHGLWKHFESF